MNTKYYIRRCTLLFVLILHIQHSFSNEDHKKQNEKYKLKRTLNSDSKNDTNGPTFPPDRVSSYILGKESSPVEPIEFVFNRTASLDVSAPRKLSNKRKQKQEIRKKRIERKRRRRERKRRKKLLKQMRGKKSSTSYKLSKDINNIEANSEKLHRRNHKKRSNSSKSSRKQRRRHVYSRHRDYKNRGIAVGRIDPPLCPPSVGPVSDMTCLALSCTTHRECGPGYGCCFNGCVHTCTKQMDRPPVFDWLEDTENVKPMFEVASPDVPSLPEYYKQSSQYATGIDTVKLAGGCTITTQQYKQLKEFMEGPNIDDCMCNGGEVVCAVKMKKN